MATVALEGVTKSYGTVQVVHGIDLDVADGEFVVLVGPSGCGKSTILRMIAGLEDITDGEIRIGGERVNEIPAKDRNLAMVFQDYALYPHMSVADNIGFGLRMHGVPLDQRATRVREMARLLQLEPYLDRKPRALSGGQRQRVAMGRASGSCRPDSSCSTSHCRISMPSCAWRSGRRSSCCTAISA